MNGWFPREMIAIHWHTNTRRWGRYWARNTHAVATLLPLPFMGVSSPRPRAVCIIANGLLFGVGRHPPARQRSIALKALSISSRLTKRASIAMMPRR